MKDDIDPDAQYVSLVHIISLSLTKIHLFILIILFNFILFRLTYFLIQNVLLGTLGHLLIEFGVQFITRIVSSNRELKISISFLITESFIKCLV